MGSPLKVMGLPAGGRHYRETRVNGTALQRAQRAFADVRIGCAVVR